MSTKTNNTGVSNHNTNMAPAAAGSGVTVNSSAVLPSVADTASALANFNQAFKPIYDALAPSISRPTAGKRVVVAKQKNETVATQVAALARRHPELASAVDPGIIEAGLAALTAAKSASTHLDVTRREVDDTGRMAFAAGWVVTNAVLLHAEHLAKDDKTLAEELAAIRAPLRQGPRTGAADRAAAAAAQKVTRAQARAIKEQQKAAAASQIAATTAAAHAARHPATPDVVIVPAGTAPTGTTPKG